MTETQEQIIIDYDGENIVNHQIDINDFLISAGGCGDLLRIVADELNIPKDAIKITIGPLEKGSVKTAIFIAIATYAAGKFADGMGIGNIIEQWGKEFITFIQAKRDSKIDSGNLPQLALDSSEIQGRLLQRKDTHQAVNDIVKCLHNDAEKITIKIPDQEILENLTRDNIDNLTTDPFNEPAEKEEEHIEEQTMKLYLESVGITSTQWTFYEKLSDKNVKRITADVLDSNLLNNARNSSLEQEYKDIPLICKVRIKIHKKAGALKASPATYYIIDCQKETPLSLFPEE